MLPFKQQANNIHFPEAEQKGRMLKLKLKQLFGFFAFGAPARSLAPFSSVGRCVCQCSSRTAVHQLGRGRRCLFSESWNHCGAKSSMRWQRQFLLLPPRTKLSVRPPPPPLRSPLTSPLPKPRPAGSLGFSPLQLYCILHAPNLKGEVQKLVIFEMYIISLNNSRKSNTT